MKINRIKLTPGQRKKLRNERHIGVGIVAWRSGENETTEVEFFISRLDGTPHYIQSGAPVVFAFTDEDEPDSSNS